MAVHKRRENPDEELVTVGLGLDRFAAELILARLRSEGIRLGSWGAGVGQEGWLDHGHRVLVRRSDLPAVEAALRDAGLA